MTDAPHADPRYLDGTFLANNPDWCETDSAWKAAQVARLLRSNALSPRSVVDVGCGTAAVLDGLRDDLPAGVRLVGYDVSPQAIELAGDRRDRLELVVGDVTESGDHFDLLLLLDVFEHVEDYLGFLRALRGVADRFVFHIPLDMNVQTVLRSRPILDTRASVGHLHYFSAETALVTLGDAGYRVVTHELTRAGIEAGSRRLRTRLASLPRRLVARASPRIAARLLGGFSLLVLAEPA